MKKTWSGLSAREPPPLSKSLLGLGFAGNVLRGLSPSLRRAAAAALRPFKKWRSLAFLSATFFLFSSLLLWAKGEGLARLGVPPDKIPQGPLDVSGQLKYAS
ncbi:hypothetical protein, conserved [Eimeria tenella]|uniref:Uncharacterized protein n=1 Tax=Eimeria tenella TaxID=5802 RepID=U6L820_EIMTE|nr:hypothetical protein, conserved [Eimeria tenella]CDJ44719.1 hypothetical protein, conserved [Eimeria tenella]|eukprot:XP_013235467.1 hypothetical protein, conserved [Eimeria tenella]